MSQILIGVTGIGVVLAGATAVVLRAGAPAETQGLANAQPTASAQSFVPAVPSASSPAANAVGVLLEQSNGSPSIASAASSDVLPAADRVSATHDGADSNAKLSREQRSRLKALQALCSQGTFTADECKAKRRAILRGAP